MTPYDYFIWTCLFIVFAFIMFMAYIKLKYPFWNLQPVQHSYYPQFTRNAYYIRHFPVKNKFYDPFQVHTMKYTNIDDNTKNELLDFLQCHYLTSENMLFIIRKPDLDKLFTGQIYPSYISLFYETYYKNKMPFIDPSYNETALFNTNIPIFNNIIKSKKPTSCITSRLAYLRFVNYPKIPIYYWDFICCKNGNDKMNHLYKLIQTHDYRCSILEPDIKAAIFKKEVELCNGIIPIVELTTTTFFIENMKIMKLPMGIVIGKNPEIIANMLDYIETSTIFTIWAISITHGSDIYYIHHKSNIYGIYFFQNTRIQHEDTEFPAIRLASSICITPNIHLFVAGYYHAMHQFIKNNDASKLNIILIDNISHSEMIINHIKQNHLEREHSHPTLDKNVLREHKTAYYMYNYSCPNIPISGNKAFILL